MANPNAMKNWIKYCYLFFLFVLTACQQNQNQFQGYAEGRFRYIASNNAGILIALPVHYGQTVRMGQTLFILDLEPEKAELESAFAERNQAEQNVKQDEANVTYTTVTYQRLQTLLTKGAIDQQSVDQAYNAMLQAIAQLNHSKAYLIAATANLTKAQWSQQQKTVVAPADSFIFDTYYLPGEQVPAGHAVLSLLASSDIKIIFFVPEATLKHLALNQTVNYKCHTCQQYQQAKISYISPQAEYTPPVIYSNQTVDKLIYRIEAMPEPAQASELHPGQPLMITLTK